MPQKCASESDVISLTLFFGHCSAKNKFIALKFCIRAACLYLDNTYFGFMEIIEILRFIGNDLGKFEVLGFRG